MWLHSDHEYFANEKIFFNNLLFINPSLATKLTIRIH